MKTDNTNRSTETAHAKFVRKLGKQTGMYAELRRDYLYYRSKGDDPDEALRCARREWDV